MAFVVQNGSSAPPRRLRLYFIKVYQFLLLLEEVIINSVAVAHILYSQLWKTLHQRQLMNINMWGVNTSLLVSLLQRQQKLLTSQPSEAWWWTPPHTQHWVILLVQQQCCPMCPLHTSRSVCDTLTLSPVQTSPRITCGWSTVRAKSLNPTGEFVCADVCLLLYEQISIFTLPECYTVTYASLCTFFQPIYSFFFCTFHLYCHPCLCCVVCSSVQLHSPLEGDQEYLLLEECESKTLPPQASLWVASHPAGTACLCGVLHMY